MQKSTAIWPCSSLVCLVSPVWWRDNRRNPMALVPNITSHYPGSASAARPHLGSGQMLCSAGKREEKTRCRSDAQGGVLVCQKNQHKSALCFLHSEWWLESIFNGQCSLLMQCEIWKERLWQGWNCCLLTTSSWWNIAIQPLETQVLTRPSSMPHKRKAMQSWNTLSCDQCKTMQNNATLHQAH